MSDRFTYHGKSFDLAILMLKNTALTILTLGIYRCWAKTDVRKHIARRVEIMGQHLDYHGTGGELFKGFLVALAVYGGVIALSELLASYLGEASQWMFTFIPVLATVIAYAFWASRRYLLTRLSWGGLRFGVEGNGLTFALKYAMVSMLALFPLATPFCSYWERKTLTESTRFGSASFRYTGTPSVFVRRTYLAFLLAPFSLGLSLVWLWVELQRYNAASTWIGGVNFRLDLSETQAFQMLIGGFFAIVFTFGLATPWVLTWSLRTYLGALRANGQPDLAQIQKIEFKSSGVGEGLAGLLDVGAAF